MCGHVGWLPESVRAVGTKVEAGSTLVSATNIANQDTDGLGIIAGSIAPVTTTILGRIASENGGANVASILGLAVLALDVRRCRYTPNMSIMSQGVRSWKADARVVLPNMKNGGFHATKNPRTTGSLSIDAVAGNSHAIVIAVVVGRWTICQRIVVADVLWTLPHV